MLPLKDQHLRAATGSLRDWLFEGALPLWWKRGADPLGGFHEQIDWRGKPVYRAQRTRTLTRQIFSFCEAGKLGWTGPWRAAARHGLEHFERHYFNADGTVIRAAERDSITDAHFDLYEQAFALLALASAYESFPDEPQWRHRAVSLRGRLASGFAHQKGGYFEDLLRQVAPLRSNPHMHLLEAALAWAEVDHDSAWSSMADEIVDLCLRYFIDPESGAVREFFAFDWSPMPDVEGRLAEPGHQYEWAFLLDWWAKVVRRSRPIEAERMVGFADTYGIDAILGTAINSVLSDGRRFDSGTRLWPQAERIRAYSVMPQCMPRLADAIAGLEKHLRTSLRGLWIERFSPDRHRIEAPSPATSLYHIVGAVAALNRINQQRH